MARGDTLLAPSVTQRLLERFAPAVPEPGPFATLSERELQVLTLIGKGRSNAEIGGELYLTEATVKTYVARMLTKLSARDRLHAVVLAYERGVLGPGSGRSVRAPSAPPAGT